MTRQEYFAKFDLKDKSKRGGFLGGDYKV